MSIAFLILPMGLAHAQYGVPGAGNTISITITPPDPTPGTTVHLSASSILLDLSQSSLTWSVNGKVLQKGIGATDIDIVAPAVGSVSNIHLDVVTANLTGSADARIGPTLVDLLFESNSYIPPFYRGRALPSAGTSMRFLALPHFVRHDGTEVPASQIDFTWKQNGQLVQSASGRGKASATLLSPALFGTDTVTVNAVSSDGAYSGSASLSIPSVEPVVTLYEDHPLFGIMYYNALGAQSFIPDAEMTFTAIPYFAQAQSADDPRLVYAWSVNNKNITPDTKKPSELTIDARKSDGLALINLALTNSANLFMNSAGSWSVSFSQGSMGSSGSPSNATDAFHQGQQ